MTDATLGQVIVAVTALVSGSLGFASGLLIEHLRSQRDRTARAEARQNQRDDFQRDNLLELQTAVARFARVVGRAHHHDTMAFRATGKWASTLLAQQLDDEYLEAQVQLQVHPNAPAMTS